MVAWIPFCGIKILASWLSDKEPALNLFLSTAKEKTPY
jgi:hypothetical protein